MTNLSASATLASVRQFFSTAGQVVEVEFVAERGYSRASSSAHVTMATPEAADAAVQRLHSRLLDDRIVMVSLVAPTEAEHGKLRRPKLAAASVAISQQYRERRGMVYELDCSGVPLTVRMFFQEGDTAGRRVEASAGDCVADASGATLEAALTVLGERWTRLSEPRAPQIEWAEVVAALKTVRAV